jgi:hypothetical protein
MNYFQDMIDTIKATEAAYDKSTYKQKMRILDKLENDIKRAWKKVYDNDDLTRKEYRVIDKDIDVVRDMLDRLQGKWTISREFLAELCDGLSLAGLLHEVRTSFTSVPKDFDITRIYIEADYERLEYDDVEGRMKVYYYPPEIDMPDEYDYNDDKLNLKLELEKLGYKLVKI